MAPTGLDRDRREMAPGERVRDRLEIAPGDLERDRIEIAPGDFHRDQREISSRPGECSRSYTVDDEIGLKRSMISVATRPMPKGGRMLTVHRRSEACGLEWEIHSSVNPSHFKRFTAFSALSAESYTRVISSMPAAPFMKMSRFWREHAGSSVGRSPLPLSDWPTRRMISNPWAVYRVLSSLGSA